MALEARWRAVEAEPGRWVVSDGTVTLDGYWNEPGGRVRAEFAAVKANLLEVERKI